MDRIQICVGKCSCDDRVFGVKAGKRDRLHGLLLLAPAPDFTHELMLPELTDQMKSDLETKGYMEEPSEYSDEPNIFTKALFDDGGCVRFQPCYVG